MFPLPKINLPFLPSSFDEGKKLKISMLLRPLARLKILKILQKLRSTPPPPPPFATLHRVGRVLSLSPVVGIRTPPTPHPPASVPPNGSGGGGHTRWREKGWEGPTSDEGTYTAVLFIYMYFVPPSHHIMVLYSAMLL
jgi:hypothetical protein